MNRTLSASLLLLATTLHARDEDNDDLHATTRLDAIHVVGSRIPRIDFEGPLPISVIEREDLIASGHVTLADVLRDLPLNSFGAWNDEPNQPLPGSRLIDLRGFGPGYTLILLDGQRLPGFSGLGGGAATSVSGLPLSAIERVEILRDGASAIYGSEAIGGVINLVTRRGALPATVSLQWSHPLEGGGRQRSADLTWGGERERGDWLLALQMTARDPLLAIQRDYLVDNAPLSNLGAPGSFRRFDPITGVPVGLAEPDPRCPNRPGESTRFPSSGLMQLPVGTFCGYRFRDDSVEWAALDSASLFLSNRQELSSGLQLDMRMMGWRNRGQTQLAPSPGPFMMAADNPFNPTLGEVAPGLGYRLQVPYRLTPLGPRRTEATDENLHLSLQLNGQTHRFDWTLAAQHNRQTLESLGSGGYALASGFQQLVMSGRFDPFTALPGEPGVLADILWTPRIEGRSRSSGIEGNLTTTVFELAQRPVDLVLGGSVRRDQYQLDFDEATRAGNVIGHGVSGAQADAGRRHAAAYLETLLPLRPTLEANFALRYDHYQDAGNATSPKLALSWRPQDSLLLRASFGHGFRVIDLERAYAADLSIAMNVADLIRCADTPNDPLACLELYPAEITLPSNPNVDPERSRQLNVGVVWQFSAGGSLGIDLHQTRLRDQIARLTGIDVSRNELACRNDGRPCNPAREGEVIRDAFGNIQGMVLPLVNIASLRQRGIDLDVSQRFATTRGDLTLSLNASHLLQFRQQPYPHIPAIEVQGFAGTPDLRANAAFGWASDRARWQLGARHIGAYRACPTFLLPNNVPDPSCDVRIRSHTELDIRFDTDLGRFGRLSLGIRNLANREPPLNLYSQFVTDLNYGLYDIAGRTPYLRYEQSW